MLTTPGRRVRLSLLEVETVFTARRGGARAHAASGEHLAIGA